VVKLVPVVLRFTSPLLVGSTQCEPTNTAPAMVCVLNPDALAHVAPALELTSAPLL
jgi:hypothetical protein